MLPLFPSEELRRRATARRFLHIEWLRAVAVALSALTLLAAQGIHAATLSATIQDFSSQFSLREAVHTVDGSGLDASNPPNHGTVATTMWLNTGDGAFGGGADPDRPGQLGHITFNLGATFEINSFRVWNYNEFFSSSNFSNRGVQTLTISTATSAGGPYTLLTNPATSTTTWTLARAPATATYTGEVITFLAPVTAAYVRFNVLTNYDPEPDSSSHGFIGLSEIRFDGIPLPPFHEYELDENPIENGTIAEDEIGTLDGTYNDNGDIVAAVGISGTGAAHFDGSGDGVFLSNVGVVHGLANFTVTAFFKPDANYASADRFIYAESAGTGGPAMFLRLGSGGTVQFGINSLDGSSYDGHIASVSPGPLDPTKWYLAVAAYSNPTITVYLYDAATRTLLGSGTASNSNPANRTNAVIGAWFLGDNSTFNNVFLGSLDDVRFYNRTLTPAEIASIPATTATPCPGTTIEFNSADIDRLVSASDDQYDDGLNNTYGSQITDPGVITFATPDVSVDWGSSDAVNGNGFSNHWLALAASAPFSTSNAFYTPNDPVAGTGPGTFYTTTPITLTAANGHAARFNSITVGNGSSSGDTQQLNVQLIVDGVTQTFSAFLNPQEKAVINLCDTPAGGVVQLQLNHPAGNVNLFHIDDLVFAQTDCTPPPANMISWWPGDGNAFDVQGNNYGTLQGDTTFVAGKVGQAFSFDGSGDGVVVGNPANLQLQTFTIDAWIKRRSPFSVTIGSGPGRIFAYGTDGYEFGLQDDGQLNLAKVGDSGVNSGTLTITDTNFHHVAVTKSGSSVVFYVDGVASAAPAYDPGFTFTTNAAIGSRGDSLDKGLNGLIDEVEIFNRALSATEIFAIYNASNAGKCKPADSDGDGDPDANDCAPNDPARNHGAVEQCNGLDDDCDGTIDDGLAANTFYRDADGDTYGNPGDPITACAAPPGYVSNNTDCDDSSNDVNPGAEEVCNGIDDDCDGQIDEGVTSTFYLDSDEDGYGDPAVSTEACSAPSGYVADNTDCDDNNAAINPGATEVCNDIDDNCDGQIDEGIATSTFYRDFDEDGYGDPANSIVDCSQPSGYLADNTDCDDTNSAVNPGATEVCNEIDDNCDGQIDEGVTTTFYFDGDGDGFGDPGNSIEACSAPKGYVADNTDCDDTNFFVNPGATEICNGIDDDCDGATDEEGCPPTVCYNGHTYMLTSEPDDWTDAEAEAVAKGGHLVTVNDAAEQAFLESHFLQGTLANRPLWIGFTDQDVEGTFVWSSGEPVTYTNWETGEPNDGGGLDSEDYTALNWNFAASGGTPPTRGGAGPPPVGQGTWNDTPDFGTNGLGGNSDGPYFGIIEIGCTLPPESMVSWWPGDGNAHDIVNANDGTLVGGATFAAGEVEQAFSFDGSDDYVQIPSDASLNPDNITFDAWIFMDDTGGSRGVFWRGDHTFLLEISSGLAKFGSKDGGGFYSEFTGSIVIPTGQWTHVALTHDGSTRKIYINGILDTPSAGNPDQAGLYTGNTDNLTIGARFTGDSQFFDGLIDEVEIFSSALSESEIKAIYNAGCAGKCKTCTPPPGGMTSWWPANGNANDIQGNHNGTLQGDTTFAPGKVGQAFSFDGNGDYVDVGDVDLPITFTIDAWINPTDPSSGGRIISKDDFGSNQSYDFATTSSGGLQAYVYNTNGDLTLYGTSGGIVVTGTFQYVAVTYDGNAGTDQKFKFYVNGVNVAGAAIAAQDAGGIPANNALSAKIGILGDGSGIPFQGLIDELELFTRVLSEAEIRALADAGSAGKCTPEIHFANISSRASVGTGENVEIAGFIIHSDNPSATTRLTSGVPPPTPTPTKRLMIRGIGPSLAVTGKLLDPFLELRDQNGAVITSNDDWGDAPNAPDIQNSGLAPSDTKEAAILRDLDADQAYTAILSGVGATSGIGLVEVYDMQGGDGVSHLANISTRANVLTGNDRLIGGIIVHGDGTTRIVFRAIGPSLATQGVSNFLADPTLELHDGNGALLQSNDNWGDSPDAVAIAATGLAPTNTLESAILYAPAPGPYTAIVGGNAPNPTGIGLVEAYNIGPAPPAP